MSYSGKPGPDYTLAFRGFLAVRLMEFDYGGKHYNYHGKKLENALNRLTSQNFTKVTTAELVILGEAVHDWKKWRDSRDVANATVGEK